jgi:predicted N-acyltransferase
MATKADIKLEVLPFEFFLELPLRLEGNVELIVISKHSRIVAFGWCFHAGSSYYMLWGGVDYRLNEELDLYFNLMYAALDRALRKRVSRIHVGQSANAFKARIGCHSEPLYVFAKGRGRAMAFMIRAAGRLLIAREPDIPSFDVFRKEGAGI